MSAARAIALVALGLSACEQRGNLTLVFPNDQARVAVRRLQVDFLAPSATAPCASFVERAEDDPSSLERFELACPVQTDGSCPPGWLDAVSVGPIPSEASVVQVRTYPRDGDETWPLAVGCSDDLDGDPIAVELALEIYVRPGSQVQPVSGVGSVGAPGSEGAAPLSVRVRSFDGTSRSSYDSPGVEVEFEVVSGDLELGAGGAFAVAVTGPDGLATIPFRFGAVGTSEVRVFAPSLERRSASGAEIALWLTAAEPVAPLAARELGALAGRPVAVDIGDSGRLAAIVACGASGVCVVDDTTEPDAELAPTELRVIRDLDRAPTLGPPLTTTGSGPVAVAVAPEASGDVVVLEARDARCRPVEPCSPGSPCACERFDGSPCACERSLLRTYDVFADVQRETYVTTSSNAVGLGRVRIDGGVRTVVAHRGRIRDPRPCTASASCTTCPVGEACIGVGGDFRCRPIQPIAQVISWDSRGASDLAACGCLALDGPVCDRPPPFFPSSCPSNPSGWSTVDACGRDVLRKVPGGAAGTQPRAFAAASVRVQQQADLLIGTDRSVELITVALTGVEATESVLVEQAIDGVLGLDLDPEVDRRFTLQPIDRDRLRGDVVWWSRAPCTPEPPRCPTVRSLSGTARGCLGVILSAGEPDIVTVDYESVVHCRRTDLEIRPDFACAADFNGDGWTDLALSSTDATDVAFVSGDGHGGLSVPPQRVPLPPGVSAGPMDCADLDGDARAEILVASRATGVVHVLSPEL